MSNMNTEPNKSQESQDTSLSEQWQNLESASKVEVPVEDENKAQIDQIAKEAVNGFRMNTEPMSTFRIKSPQEQLDEERANAATDMANSTPMASAKLNYYDKKDEQLYYDGKWYDAETFKSLDKSA